MSQKNKNRQFQLPHTVIILAGVALFMVILTHVVPAGEYDRIVNAQGTTVVDPDSFHYIEPSPVGFLGFITAFPRGFVESAQIIAMSLFLGAGFQILTTIGLIDILISNIAAKFQNKRVLAIPMLMIIFATINAFIGMDELNLIYVPIILPLMLKLGFDSMTAIGTVILGTISGFTAAFTNPFTVAVAQKLCGLPLYSGWQFRVFVFIVVLSIGITYVSLYARKVLADPTKSLTYEEDRERREIVMRNESAAPKEMSGRLKIAGIYSILIFVVMIGGIINLGWDMNEMAGLFVVLGVGAGLIAGLDSRKMCDEMIKGAESCLSAGIYICLARAISVIMTDGAITDTIVHAMQGLLVNLPAHITIVGVLICVSIINFFIISGSGKAVVLFPILTPLADICGITRQTAVVAYQLGDGFTNYFYPTGGILMACLGMVNIPWNKWAKFYLPLLAMWYVAAVAFVIIAQIIKLGPF